MLPPAHPAPQLVELAQTKAVRVLDDDERGVWHVHPHLDHRGGYQHLSFPLRKGPHGRVLLLGAHLPMEDIHRQVGEHLPLEALGIALHRLQRQRRGLFTGQGGLRVLLHRGTDDIHLPALPHLAADELIHPLPLVLPDDIGGDGGAPRGELVDDGHI